MAREFEGKVAVVTAGASGIGKSAVFAFAREGARVVIADIDTKAGEAFVRQLQGDGVEALFVRTDVTEERQVEGLIGETIEKFGRLDFAFNNAGGEKVPGPSEETKDSVDEEWTYEVPSIPEMSLGRWDDTVALNLTSIFLSMKHQIPHMIEGGGGAIVNTTSIAGILVGAAATPAYSAAKAGVIHLSRYAAAMHGRDGIRVNAVAPGLTATPSVMRYLSEEMRNAAITNQVIPSMVQPEDLAEAVIWLCSEKASKVTGLTIPVDAGGAAPS